MAYNVVVGCLMLSLFLLFVAYFKYVKMKQHFSLLEVACACALYKRNNSNDKRPDIELIMKMLQLWGIPWRKHYIEEICIDLENLERYESQLKLIEDINTTMFETENK